MDVEAVDFGCHAPAVESEVWLERWRWLDKLGHKAWPVLGGAYCVLAVKRCMACDCSSRHGASTRRRPRLRQQPLASRHHKGKKFEPSRDLHRWGLQGQSWPWWLGVLLQAGPHRKELSGGELNTTNNRMELTAVIEALRALKRPCDVALYLDSEYVRKGITEWIHGWKAKGWKTAAKQPVKNAELWQELDHLVSTAGHRIAWHWVKGHAGDPGNEKADELANKGVDLALGRI